MADSQNPAKRAPKQRRAEEDDNQHLPVKILMPDTLKKKLVEDWGLIEQKQTVPLPRSPNVVTILQGYLEHIGSAEPEVKDLMDSIENYFDQELRTNLLYKGERFQNALTIEKFPEKKPSAIWGAEHLLRLLSRLPKYLSKAEMEPETLEFTCKHLDGLLQFIKRNVAVFFNTNYEPAVNQF